MTAKKLKVGLDIDVMDIREGDFVDGDKEYKVICRVWSRSHLYFVLEEAYKDQPFTISSESVRYVTRPEPEEKFTIVGIGDKEVAFMHRESGYTYKMSAPYETYEENIKDNVEAIDAYLFFLDYLEKQERGKK